MCVSLNEVEAMVDSLTPSDQVRLLRYLVPRLAGSVMAREANAVGTEASWEAFRAVGDRVAATPAVNGESMTIAVSQMRR